MIEQAEATCKKLSIQLSGGSTKVSKAVNCPVATVTGIGRSSCEQIPKAKPGQDIVITKWIGLEGLAYSAT